jgi:hypothetical protein
MPNLRTQIQRIVSFTNGSKLCLHERSNPMKSHVLLTAVCFLSFAALVGPAGAGERVLIPEEMDLPWYTGFLGFDLVDSVCGVAFFRPFETAPGDLLLNDWITSRPDLDPADYPLSIEGFGVLQEGTPVTGSLYNRPGETVTMCFYSVEDGMAVWEGGTTMDEIRAMPSLLVGEADFWVQIINAGCKTVIASGVLEDGRSFSVHTVETDGLTSCDYRFGD